MAVEKLLQTVKCSAQHMQASCLSVRQAHLDSGGVGCEKTLLEAQKSFGLSLPSVSVTLHALPRALWGEWWEAVALELVPVPTLSRGRDYQGVLSKTYRWPGSLESAGGLNRCCRDGSEGPWPRPGPMPAFL